MHHRLLHSLGNISPVDRYGKCRYLVFNRSGYADPLSCLDLHNSIIIDLVNLYRLEICQFTYYTDDIPVKLSVASCVYLCADIIRAGRSYTYGACKFSCPRQRSSL